jgi:mannose-6-phosphate isomerase-like protein (cupin superfamily)
VIGADTIENPVTGERIRFLPSGGDDLRFEISLRPGGFVPFAHVHPNQEERFEILAGRPRFRIGREQRDVQPGEVVVVPPGIRHAFHNPTEDEVRILITFAPSMRTEELFRVFFALAEAGKLSRRAVPYNLLLGARLAHEYRREARTTGFPLGFAHRLSPAGAMFARILRLRLPDV